MAETVKAGISITLRTILSLLPTPRSNGGPVKADRRKPDRVDQDKSADKIKYRYYLGAALYPSKSTFHRQVKVKGIKE